jgi:hypothetical protein
LPTSCQLIAAPPRCLDGRTGARPARTTKWKRALLVSSCATRALKVVSVGEPMVALQAVQVVLTVDWEAWGGKVAPEVEQ